MHESIPAPRRPEGRQAAEGQPLEGGRQLEEVQPLEQVRQARRDCVREEAAARYWRRLVRARLDLAVAAAAHPDLPTTTHPALGDLPGLVLGPAQWTWELLLQLDQARRALDEEAERASDDVRTSTDELVDRYAQDPAACLPRR